MKRMASLRGFAALLTAVAVIDSSSLAIAQSDLGRVVFVDMNKVFDEFYKTKLAEGQLKEQEAEYRDELKKMVDSFKKLQEAFRQAREESEDRVLSEEARNARRAEAEEKLVELREMESKIRRFEETRRRQIADQMKRVRDKLVVEIKETLSGYAKKEGFIAVLETSGDNLNGVPNVLYYDPSRDITAALIDLLNTGRK
jgi:outer membrane protein